ncbi:ATP-binding cassette domain-containing protein [Mobilicoccus sp.]|uniref:ATP-binding cassette domain-containing protein n=1 Tax=Mobilicoccus sp. TaxID=2034349 RepID=UPI00289A143E|nr:ATP-binding cassette domain-containing protein [Mobilicoccus sp.]
MPAHPAEPGHRITLDVLVGEHRRTLDAGRAYTIGRDPGADLHIDHPEVSRRHAVVVCAPTGWVIRDTGSLNGLHLAGNRLTEIALVPGTSVRLGGSPDAPVLTVGVPGNGASPASAADSTADSAAASAAASDTPRHRGEASGQGPMGGGGADRAGSPSGSPVGSPATSPAPSVPRGAPGGAPDAVPVGDRPGVGAGAVHAGPASHAGVGGGVWSDRPADGSIAVAHHSASAVVTIGRDPANTIVLDDLLVSRRHVRATPRPTGFWIEDLGSVNGTYIDGAPVTSALLTPRSLLTIGHHEFRIYGDDLMMVQADTRVSFVADHLSYRLPSGKTLLGDVSFDLPDSSLLAVIGPSGAGKSTLLNALTGARPATRGTVTFDGRDLYANYAELRDRIGVVPQDDVVHPQLTVRQALEYSSLLRFPADLDTAARRARIGEVVEELGLSNHLDTRVDALSGGQRKRTSVALELLTRPSLLFLDEPTSGLDPGLDKSVMTTLRTLADDGRTVVVITHSVANLGLCDRVLLLAPGGYIAFFGRPEQVLPYFGLTDYSDVFERVTADPMGSANRYARWAATSGSRAVAPPAAPVPSTPPRRQPVIRQTLTLVRRHLRVLTADRSYALFTALLPLVLAALVAAVPGEAGFTRPAPTEPGEAAQLLVVLLVGAAFMGMAASARDLVGERPILRREKAVGLSTLAYLTAKLIVFALLTAVQSIALVTLVLLVKTPPDIGAVGDGRLELYAAVALTAFASAALGLLISSVVGTTEQVMPLLVVSIMAQLVLCGGLIPVVGRPVLEQLAWLTPSRWGYAAGASTIDLLGRTIGRDDDPLWHHTAHAWGTDMAALGVIALIASLLTLWRLSREGHR